MTVARLSWMLVVALAAPGCFWVTSRSAGDELRRDVDVMRVRLETKEAKLAAQIEELQRVFDEASSLLTRNSASLGNSIAELRAEIRETTRRTTLAQASLVELTQGMSAMRTRIDQVESRIAQFEGGKATSRSSPDELWTLGSQAFEVQRYKEAGSLFAQLAETFPTHVRADDATYFRGQSLGHLKEWTRAIAAYQLLRQRYPKSPLADDGLYFAALAAKELKNCTEARTYLAIVKASYPRTNVAAPARKLDAQIRKVAKKKAVCTS